MSDLVLMSLVKAVAFTFYLDTGSDLSGYTSGLTFTLSNSTPSVVVTVNNASITQSDPQSNGYNTAASVPLTSTNMDQTAGRYSYSLTGDTGSAITTLAEGYIDITSNEVRGAFQSGDGTAGSSGTITLASTTSITVKDGIITGWS
jgi:hypothetical protein